jgi:two-component system, chemotaxis family, sensor kinase CheA
LNEFIEQFLLESRELVDQAAHDLLALEQRPNDKDRFDQAFRAFHTLKGGAGIVDFNAMVRALHAAEDILAAGRSGAHLITSRDVSDCLACLNQITEWLNIIERNGELPAHADSAAEAVIARLNDGRGPDTPSLTRADLTLARPVRDDAFAGAAREILNEQLLLLAGTTADDAPGRATSAARVAANVLRRKEQPDAADEIERALRLAETHRDPTILSAAIARCLAGPTASALEPAADGSPMRQEAAARTLRIDADRVDTLVALAGELTVAKNALGHLAKLALNLDSPLASALREQHASLDRLVGVLQHAVLAIRVLPLRHVFQRFPRLMREIAESLGKQCRVITEGDDTEADKTIVEALYEPLLHIMRNAIDHGVEAPPLRAGAGKLPIATIYLRGLREGDRVLIEVEDDGAGIDIDKVRRQATARGFMSDENVANLSDAQAIELIFEPGFSTATGVTGLSGRGVGMDVVRTAVERLGGRVSLTSERGVGSTVRFDLPFSVMLTQVMTVEAGGQWFGIPLEAILEIAEIDRDRISPIGRARAFVRRGRTIPIVDLDQTLRREVWERTSPRALLIVVAIAGQFGAFEVDRIGERLEVILKPVAGLLSGMPWISGTTLLGDGSVLLVLDVVGLLS